VVEERPGEKTGLLARHTWGIAMRVGRTFFLGTCTSVCGQCLLPSKYQYAVASPAKTSEDCPASLLRFTCA